MQLSLFDVLGLAGNIDGKYTSSEIEEVIDKLREAKRIAEKHEANENRRREKEEAERKAREEKKRKEEHVREVTCMNLPPNWNNVFNSDARTQGIHTERISDALIMSLNTLGKVDIEYISSVTGADYKTVISTLKGSIYQNPMTWSECFYQGWETAEEYLSGNLMRKRNDAIKANEEYNGYFEDNIKAIEKVLPPTVATKDIYIMPAEKSDSIGNDPINAVEAWITEGYLNIKYQFYHSNNQEKKHMLNLVVNEEIASENTRPDYFLLEFRHNAYEDAQLEPGTGVVSFKLDNIMDSIKDKQGINIRVKSLHDGIVYIPVEISK